MPERMPIGRDIDLLCDAVTWVVQRPRPAPLVHTQNIQRHVLVGWATAERLLRLMDDYGVTSRQQHPGHGRSVLMDPEQLPAVLASLRHLAKENTDAT
jgi:hypothetical protein